MIPGWYGKLPGVGDFASRRLPEEFIRPWDAWLQEVIAATQASLGADWLELYLTMPIWRFVLGPGLIGRTGWAGVLMPSVDRVGRRFPLTLAVGLPSDAALVHAVFEAGDWFSDLEDAALGVLDPARGADELERSLANCGLEVPPGAELDGREGPLRRLPSIEAFPFVAKAESLQGWASLALWKGLWWTRGRVDGDPVLMTCAALPTVEEFGRLVQCRLVHGPGIDTPAELREGGDPSEGRAADDDQRA
jgi:type VI secretion system protein ImpM